MKRPPVTAGAVNVAHSVKDAAPCVFIALETARELLAFRRKQDAEGENMPEDFRTFAEYFMPDALALGAAVADAAEAGDHARAEVAAHRLRDLLGSFHDLYGPEGDAESWPTWAEVPAWPAERRTA